MSLNIPDLFQEGVISLCGSLLTFGNVKLNYTYTSVSIFSNHTRYNTNIWGTWQKATYNYNGKRLSYKNNTGYWAKWTYDAFGDEISYTNSTIA